MSADPKAVGVLVMDFEEFAARHGALMADIGDAGTHMRGRNQSDKQWKRITRLVERRSDEVLGKRLSLRDEYNAAVERGEIRPLTRMERLRRAAAGHPDLESVAAARRLLAKHEDKDAALARCGGAS